MYDQLITWKLLTVAIAIGGGLYVFQKSLTSRHQRQFLYFFVAGLTLWSGIGSAWGIVVDLYLWMFIGFFFLFGITFVLSSRVLNNISPSIEFSRDNFAFNPTFWKCFIIFYLILSTFPLIYPEFKIGKLLRPPAPDIMTMVEERLGGKSYTALERLVYYCKVLFFPFFLFALHALGRKLWLVGLTIFLYFYTDYCNTEYISRHEVGLLFLLLFQYAWHFQIIPKSVLVIASLLALPPFIIFLNIYVHLRLGAGMPAAFDISGLVSSLVTLFYQETAYPIRISDMITSNYIQEDISRYFLWIISLPIPQQLTVDWDFMNVGHEFTEYALGGVYGQTVTHIILPGLVGESIFIYGTTLWWIHPLTIALILSVICHFLRRDSSLFFVMCYFQLKAFLVGRAGFGIFLILSVNYMLIFWAFLAFLIYKSKGATHPRGPKYMPQDGLEISTSKPIPRPPPSSDPNWTEV